jgi:hypothetical protein
VPGVDSREERSRRARHRHADSRLQDAIAFRHAAQARVEVRPVERVDRDADESTRRIPRQARVAVQGDDVLDVGKDGRIAHVDRVTRIGRAAQQPVELLELAALAFPTHPRAFTRIPLPGAMEQVEQVAALPADARVELGDAGTRRLDEQRIVRHLGRLGIARSRQGWRSG